MTDKRMSSEQLAAIRQRVANATPNNWVWYSSPVVPEHHRLISDGPDGDVLWVRDGNIAYDERDAAFIAHARQDVLALLAEVERLRAENDKLRALAADMLKNLRLDVVFGVVYPFTRDMLRTRAESLGVEANDAE